MSIDQPPPESSPDIADAERIETPTKCLSVRQPWAGLIIHGYKPLENRSWSTSFRGRIAIHASSHDDSEAYRQWALGEPAMAGGMAYTVPGPELLDRRGLKSFRKYLTGKYGPIPSMFVARSAIIGTVELIDVIDMRREDSVDQLPSECEGYTMPPAAWYGGSEFAWIFANPIAIDPIDSQGKLNLWLLNDDQISHVGTRQQRAIDSTSW